MAEQRSVPPKYSATSHFRPEPLFPLYLCLYTSHRFIYHDLYVPNSGHQANQARREYVPWRRQHHHLRATRAPGLLGTRDHLRPHTAMRLAGEPRPAR